MKIIILPYLSGFNTFLNNSGKICNTSMGFAFFAIQKRIVTAGLSGSVALSKEHLFTARFCRLPLPVPANGVNICCEISAPAAPRRSSSLSRRFPLDRAPQAAVASAQIRVVAVLREDAARHICPVHKLWAQVVTNCPHPPIPRGLAAGQFISVWTYFRICIFSAEKMIQ
jgi:hypothetical protein